MAETRCFYGAAHERFHPSALIDPLGTIDTHARRVLPARRGARV